MIVADQAVSVDTTGADRARARAYLDIRHDMHMEKESNKFRDPQHTHTHTLTHSQQPYESTYTRYRLPYRPQALQNAVLLVILQAIYTVLCYILTVRLFD